jgi:hypothetical protein
LRQPLQHPRSHRKVALVVAEAEAKIGVDRVEALILQRIGAQLVDQPDAAPLLTEVQQYPPSRSGDRGDGVAQLRPAVAF